MKILLLLPLLLGFSVPAIAHNEANGGRGGEWFVLPPIGYQEVSDSGEGEGAETEDEKCFSGECGLGRVSP